MIVWLDFGNIWNAPRMDKESPPSPPPPGSMFVSDKSTICGIEFSKKIMDVEKKNLVVVLTGQPAKWSWMFQRLYQDLLATFLWHDWSVSSHNRHNYSRILNNQSGPVFWASLNFQSFAFRVFSLVFKLLDILGYRVVDREVGIMAVEVKHPIDSASADLLEVSRHRIEPLSTRMEERDADVVKVSLSVIFSCKIQSQIARNPYHWSKMFPTFHRQYCEDLAVPAFAFICSQIISIGAWRLGSVIEKKGGFTLDHTNAQCAWNDIGSFQHITTSFRRKFSELTLLCSVNSHRIRHTKISDRIEPLITRSHGQVIRVAVCAKKHRNRSFF